MPQQHKLLDQMREKISTGLKRRAITTCSKWAESYVVLGGSFPGPFRTEHYPWMKGMLDSTARVNIGQKSAQMGYSVVALNKTLYTLDIERLSCLYLLPTKFPDATDFSSTRFNPMLEMSPHLASLFSDVKNINTKRAGSAALYIRGANSRSGLKSIPVSFIVFDEYDEMPEENIPLARERMSGQLKKQEWLISTPTAPEILINAEFLESTQEHFIFPCPSCSRHIELGEENLVVTADSILDTSIKDSHFICTQCKAVLPHAAKPDFLSKAQWIPLGSKDYERRGFYINQLYSPTIEPFELAVAKLRALTNLHAEQEWYNSKLGLPHLTNGARVNDEQIEKAKHLGGGYTKGPRPAKIITMGVDVGRVLHFVIAAWHVKQMGNDLNVMSQCQVLAEGSVESFDQLDRLIKDYQVYFTVIDSRPETRKAYEFAQRFFGRVKLCYYANNLKGSNAMNVPKEPGSHSVSVDRTSWMDMALGRFHNGTIMLPRDISQEYREHVKSPMRLYKEDATGHPVGYYKNKGPDHLGHAQTYAEIALPLAASLATNRDVSVFI
jgi:hypothetical protein